ncbi:hypothetical protein LZ30DRAFT_372910 [Colletotrichum cereale]|nr:hypothetical protein LZ30DRAFT_372910 [Colletotrichum cereale]
METPQERRKETGNIGGRRDRRGRTNTGTHPPSAILDAAAHSSRAARRASSPPDFIRAQQTLVTTKVGDGQAVQCPASPWRQPAGLGSVPAVAYSSGPVCSPAAARDLREMTMTRQSGRHPAQFRASAIDAGWLERVAISGGLQLYLRSRVVWRSRPECNPSCMPSCQGK